MSVSQLCLCHFHPQSKNEAWKAEWGEADLDSRGIFPTTPKLRDGLLRVVNSPLIGSLLNPECRRLKDVVQDANFGYVALTLLAA